MGKVKIPKTQHFSGSKQYHNSHQVGIAHMIFAPLFVMFILWMMFLSFKRFKFYTMLMLFEFPFWEHPLVNHHVGHRHSPRNLQR